MGLVHFADPQSMDYPISGTTKWTTLMDSQMDYLDGLAIWTTSLTTLEKGKKEILPLRYSLLLNDSDDSGVDSD